MNSTDFTYWLQGFVELTETSTISEKQWQVIKDHLKLVFDKKTPFYDIPNIEIKFPNPIDTKKLADLIGTTKFPAVQYPYDIVTKVTC